MKDYRPWLLAGVLALGAFVYLHKEDVPAPEPDAPAQPVPAAKIKLLLFCIDGCAPCARLHQALNEPAVKKALERFDLQEADPGEGGEYEVSGYPTLVAITSAGPVKKVGFHTSADLIRWLDSVK